MKNRKGFTLIEMLVVVLIIGILAGIALPQYQMAVTKAKVASILPLMRRWKDALAEYKLQHGSYMTEDNNYPDADTLGVNWPSDWECSENGLECSNDFWWCDANENYDAGEVTCAGKGFSLIYFQEDQGTLGWGFIPKGLTCSSQEQKTVCKALGGDFIGETGGSTFYQL